MPVAMITKNQRLDDCRGRLQELRSRQVRARNLRDATKKSVGASGGAVDPHSEDFRRLERAVQDLQEIETSIAMVK